ncbi:hexose transporter [Babesia caballi]|uniref:Hexose transporter n=1 Tax=Babesia caballi TaxID=5871 RepID=A0AAV4LZZ7_BABCB|nr:hexose transporter [Babesia caballi]
MSLYFWAALYCAAVVALNFGVICVSVGASKQFAYKEMDIYDDEEATGQTTPGTSTGSSKAFYANMISGSVFLGCAIGSALIGLLSNWGRRKCMIFMHILSITGCLIAAVGWHWVLFMIGRLLAGISVGMSGIGALYLSEICAHAQRGLFGSLYSIFVTFGELSISAWQLTHGTSLDPQCVADKAKPPTNHNSCVKCPAEDSAHKEKAVCEQKGKCLNCVATKDKLIWRFGQLVGALLSVSALVLLKKVVVDDTPFFLMQDEDVSEAKRVIGLLQGKDRVVPGFKELLQDMSLSKGEKIGVLEALQKPDARQALFVVFFMACIRQLCGIYVFTLGASELFGQIVGKGWTATAWGQLCPLVNFLVCCVMPLYIDKFGRRNLLIYGSGFGTAVLVVALLLQLVDKMINSNGPKSTWAQYTMIIGCVAFVAGFSTGYGGVSWMYFSEALAPEYRDAAFGWASVINWATAAVIVTTAKPMQNYLGEAVYWVYAGFSCISCLFAIGFVKETKGIPMGQAYVGASGVSLGEIISKALMSLSLSG